MGDVVYEGQVDKFSLGRSTGLTTRNWKSRHMRLTRSTLSYMDKPNGTAKLEVPVSAISLVFTNPSKAEHEEANPNQPQFALRLFENGVFTLLVKAPNDAEKAKWLSALRDVLAKSKGTQVV